MRVLIVDDELMSLDEMQYMVSEYDRTIAIDTASSSREAIELAMENRYDIAFLDIDMPVKNGIELARVLTALDPNINIVFVTGYREYGYEAFTVNASAYLIKPISMEKLKEAFKRLRNPIKSTRMFVRCFGNFEVFYDNIPVHFARSKAKELFAYLIDCRGAAVSSAQMGDILWSDSNRPETYKSYIRRLIADIRLMLEEHDCSDVLISRRDSYAVNVNEIKCDYYDFLNGTSRDYHGEYMNQYSWAEPTHARLETG